MPYNVKFNFRDSRGRPTSRTYHNTQALIADALTDAGTLAALMNPLTDLALEGITLSVKNSTINFAGSPPSSIDSNVSLKVVGGDGFGYDVDLPAVPNAKTTAEQMSLADADLVAFTNAFGVGGTWRVNLRNPTDIATLVSATLDK